MSTRARILKQLYKYYDAPRDKSYEVSRDQLRYSRNFFNAPLPSLQREKERKEEGGRGLKQCSSGLEARGGLTRTTQAWKVGGNTDKSINEAFGLF